jgi:two-component system, LytTR family, response regulator
MVNAIIIDDEKNAIDVLTAQLTNYCPEVKILQVFQSGIEAVDAINELEPELIFLDIEMPLMNGFEVLNNTKNKNFKVIFTTAYDQFAIKAFKYATIDYLLKPIDIEELKAAIKKITTLHEYNLSIKLNTLFDRLNTSKNKPSKIALPIGDAFEMIAFENIIRCESESNYCLIHLMDKRKVTVSKTLKEVEESLQDGPFFRIHNSHLINIEHISKLYKADGGYVIMSDNAQVAISRAKKDEFYNFIKKV